MTTNRDSEAVPSSETEEFAHHSERQFARLLDFYGIDWEYEPTAFPIDFDDANEPVKYFTPDFYLPGEGIYIEITTMNQRLVTKKNRKVRRLREVHPEVKCKVFYQRDYVHLLLKYGLEDATGDLPAPSRLPGPPQVTDLGARRGVG